MPSHTPQFVLALLMVALLCAAPAYGAYEGGQYLGVEDNSLLRAAAAGGLAVAMILVGLLYCLTELKELHKRRLSGHFPKNTGLFSAIR